MGELPSLGGEFGRGQSGGTGRVHVEKILTEEKAGVLKSVKAPNPREEKGRENRGAVVAAASGDLKSVNDGDGLRADEDEEGDSTGNTAIGEIDWREISSTGPLAIVKSVVEMSAAGSRMEA